VGRSGWRKAACGSEREIARDQGHQPPKNEISTYEAQTSGTGFVVRRRALGVPHLALADGGSPGKPRAFDTTTCLQIGGILLGAIAGLLATFTDTRTENKKSLTAQGYWALSLTTVGTILGVFGQIFSNHDSQMEILKSEEQSAKVLVNLATQASYSTNILGSIQQQGVVGSESLSNLTRILNRFETFGLRITYIIPTNDARLGPLFNGVRSHFSALHSPHETDSTASVGSAIPFCLNDVHTGEIHTNETAWYLLKLLGQNPIYMQVSRQTNFQSTGFEAKSNPPETADLFYLPETGYIEAVCQFAFPRSGWRRYSSMATANDLAKAWIRFGFEAERSRLLALAIPVSGQLECDEETISLKGFQSVSHPIFAMQVRPQTAERILNREVLINRPRMSFLGLAPAPSYDPVWVRKPLATLIPVQVTNYVEQEGQVSADGVLLEGVYQTLIPGDSEGVRDPGSVAAASP